MRENDIYKLIRQLLVEIAPKRFPTPLGYQLSFQPTQEGRPSTPTVFFAAIGNYRYGWMSRESKWDSAAGSMRLHETQAMETTVQFSAYLGNSTDPNAATPSDALSAVCGVMQGEEFIEKARIFGIQVLRVTDQKIIPFQNESNQWERMPTFDIVIKHTDYFVDSVQIVNAFEFEMHAVPDII